MLSILVYCSLLTKNIYIYVMLYNANLILLLISTKIMDEAIKEAWWFCGACDAKMAARTPSVGCMKCLKLYPSKRVQRNFIQRSFAM